MQCQEGVTSNSGSTTKSGTSTNPPISPLPKAGPNRTEPGQTRRAARSHRHPTRPLRHPKANVRPNTALTRFLPLSFKLSIEIEFTLKPSHHKTGGCPETLAFTPPVQIYIKAKLSSQTQFPRNMTDTCYLPYACDVYPHVNHPTPKSNHAR